MSDLIDRQAAINLWNKYHYTIAIDAMRYDTELRQLPPAEPMVDIRDTQYNLPVGTDTISRAKAIVALGTITVYKGSIPFDTAMMRIEQLPPAQPEIIRCKDCKHWIPYDWMFSEVWRSKNMADYPEDEIGCNYCDMTMKANDFCSRAERRTE